MADIYGFNKADSDALLGLIGKNNGESKQHNEILEQPWFFIGKMDAQLSPGDQNGTFRPWDYFGNVATDIVIEDVTLPSSAENPAPFDITEFCGIMRCGVTGRWFLVLDYKCVTGG